VELPGRIVAKVWRVFGLSAAAWHSALVKEPRSELVAVVEDEKNIRETVVFALKREGYRVNSYADGAEAWNAFRQQLPDLAVLDILLPRMDGRELCRKLRARSETLPIIFLTSKDEELDRVLGLELGADDYLCKPFAMRELVARIKVLFRRASLSGDPAARDAFAHLADKDPLARFHVDRLDRHETGTLVVMEEK